MKPFRIATGALCALFLGSLAASLANRPQQPFADQQPSADQQHVPAQERAPFRVLTFNVRYGTADDGDDRWEARKHRVVAALRAHGADLIGLQEALPFQVEHLAAALPAHTSYSQGRERGDAELDREVVGTGETCALFWRDDRFEALERGTFWLAPELDEVGARGWDAALPRICSWVRLRDRFGGESFVFANTHFDHRGPLARYRSADPLALGPPARVRRARVARLIRARSQPRRPLT